ncbi:hypothetical protein K4K48_009125 [Colletotrichum sp. SAR 10_66]|nr:hypothetical protein K4K48_009125 [Colletotrichum sp. SAR 10_66]
MADTVDGGGGGGGEDEHAANQAVPLPPWECLKDAMSPLQCGKAFYFDTRGDLTLRVGKDEAAYEFVVCSRTLGRSSAVFQAMLFGGFAESKPAHAAWTVQIPEDLPSPTFLVLSIIHGYFEHIPGALTLDQLYLVLVTTEKYDMTKILRPWASIWFDSYKKTSSTANNDMLLWISWELGQTDVFCRLVNDLVLMAITGIGLKKVALLDTPTPEYRGSVKKLARDIQNMTIGLPGEHKACSPLSALKQKAKKLVKDAASPVTDVHLQHLENQAKKTGI